MTLDSTERLTIMRQNTGVNVEESCCKENFVLSVLKCIVDSCWKTTAFNFTAATQNKPKLDATPPGCLCQRD